MASQLTLFDDIVEKFVSSVSSTSASQSTTAAHDGGSYPMTSVEQRKTAAYQLCFPQSVFRYLGSVSLLTSETGTAKGSHPPLAPFENDSAFLVGKEHVYIMMTWVRNAGNLHLHEGMAGLLRQADFPLVAVTALLSEMLTRLVSLVTYRANSMVEAPRLIRVARALGMTEKEQEALCYLQVCHSGSNFVFSFPNALVPSAVAKYAELTPQELLHFLSEHREHIRQGVIQMDAMGRISMMDSKLTIPQEVVAAFTGESLPEEQLIKLEKTSLATVLLAERNAAAAGVVSTSLSGDAANASTALPPPSLPREESSKKRLRVDEKHRSHKSRRGEPTTPLEGEDSSEDNEEFYMSGGSGSSDDDDGSDDEGSGDDEDFSESDLKSTVEKLVAIHRDDAAKGVSLLTQLAPVVFKSSAAKSVLRKMSPALADLLETSNFERAGSSRKSAAPKSNGGKTEKRRGGTHAADASRSSSPLLKDVTTVPPSHVASSSSTASPLLSNRSAPVFASASASKMNEPYTTDIDYIDDAFKLLSNLIKIRNAEGDMKDDVEDNFYNVPKTKVEATIRELKGKFRLQSHIHRSRVQATYAAAAGSSDGNGFLPRIEQVAKKLSLSEMEKLILLLLVGNVVSHDVLIAINGRYVMRDGQRELNVGYMLFVLCEGLKERVASRRYFYQSAPLIAHGLITVNLTSTVRSCFNTDLTDYAVDIDRKIVDYLMGTEMETGEMVPGSKLYKPTVPLENVILPTETTHLVLNTIQHFTLFDECKRQCGFGEGLGTGGSGLVFLFYGPSGTGKTMLANAVAHNLAKKLLLVNLLQFKGDTRSPDALRFIFREAKLNDAVVFFDECETFFETREANPLVTALLAEFEKYDGIIILATNRAQVIDEAMNRRISLMIEFKLPDHQMRERIWRAHLPKHLPLASDVNLETLALDYELTGGLIRNAMLAAISSAVARENTSTPTLVAADFVSGAKRQLRGFFLAAEKTSGAAESYTTPKRSLDELVVDPAVRHQLETIAKLAKSRNTLFSQWGFNEDDCAGCQGVAYLFSGPSGTGKTLAVEGIAYECGSTVRACNVQELLMTSGKDINVSVIFEEARKLGAIVVFDNAQALFDYSERAQQLSQLIMYHAVLYPRPVIVVATTGGTTGASSSSASVDSRGSKLQFTEEISFSMPNRALRKELWKRSLPSKVPISADVDFNVLSESQVTAKLIKSVCFSVCCKVALLTPDERRVTMKALKDELEDFVTKDRRRSTHSNMFAQPDQQPSHRTTSPWSVRYGGRR